MKIKMKDIAEAVGVNTSTVSRALSGSPKVSEKKREEILRIAEEMGYRPDPMVSVLMAQRRGKQVSHRGTIATVTLWPEGEDSWLELPYYASFREGIDEQLTGKGYKVDAFRCDGSQPQCQRLTRILRARGIQGIILTQSHESFDTLPFSPEGLVVVSLAASIVVPAFTKIMEMREENMRVAWRQLRVRGHKRICFLTWATLAKKNRGAWLGTLYHCQQELPKASRLPPGIFPQMTLDFAIPHIEKYQPDALLSENSGLLHQIQSVYPDLACYTLDRNPGDSFSGINVRRKQIGIAAADAVMAQLMRGERGLPVVAKRIMIDGEWVDVNDDLEE